MPAPDQSDDSPRTRTIRLGADDLDGGGGCRLTGLEGIVRVVGDDLRSLDIEDSPELEALDLGDCRDDLRLHFTRLPALQWVQLPDGETGATVELALPPDFTPISPLVLDGPIADFGVCAPWLVQPWRLDGPVGKRPVAGLAIGPPSANPPGRSVAAHLVVGRACREERLVMNCRGISHLLIMGARLRELELRHASLERLQISECSKLERIHGRFQARTASISLCRSLASVGGSGRQLDIAVTRSSSLRLEGRWLDTRIALSDCLALQLERPTRLALESLPLLLTIDSRCDYQVQFDKGMFGPNQLACRLAGEPGELTRVFERERRHLGDRSRISTHWMRHLAMTDRGRHVPGSLSALRDIAAGSGVDREACWLIRCQLAAQRLEQTDDFHRPAYAFRRGSSGWNWSVFNEPQMVHWLDDLSLYSMCADLPVTAPFRRTLRRLDRMLHAVLLAAALADRYRPEIRQVEIRGYLRACLARLDLAHELKNAPPKPLRPMQPRWFHRHATPWWCQFGEGLESLIQSLGVIDDGVSTRHLADRLLEVDDAEVMQTAALSMYSTGMSQWRKVLVAGMDAPGKVSPYVYRRSLQLLLSGQPEPADA